MQKYTREKLIELCERAIVPERWWMNRDSSSAQEQIGQALVFLKAGCDFKVLSEDNNDNSSLITDEDTVWVEIYVEGFKWFEYGGGDDLLKDEFTCYIPTEKCLNEANGGDWY